MEKESEEKGIKLKIIVVGQTGVGKTNLINIVRNKPFSEQTESSSMSTLSNHEMKVDGKLFNVSLWDTMGQEQFREIVPLFFKGANIVILVYDITCKETFLDLKNWMSKINEHLGQTCVLGLLGNKKDLIMNEEVTENEAQEYAKSIEAVWNVTSAKEERKGFLNFLNALIKKYMEKYNISKPEDFIKSGLSYNSISLDDSQIPKEKSICCLKKKINKKDVNKKDSEVV